MPELICRKCNGPRTQQACGRFKCRACEREYQKAHYRKHIEKMRKRKSDHMARARRGLFTREKYLGYQRKAYENGGSQKQRERMERMRIDEPFRWKAKLLRPQNSLITADHLKSMWDAQRGLCALSGQPMEIDDAQIDHIIPRSRGGSSDLSNLQWTTSRANAAKQNMTEEEFLALCKNVAEWIARRILESES